jgi:hypothetical protein
VYLIADAGWVGAAKPRLIVETKEQKSKETPDFNVGKKKFTSDLIPATFLSARYFAGEQVSIDDTEGELAALEQQLDELRSLGASVPREREGFRYAPDKWSVREVFGHLIDGERIFGLRAFCFSRGERAPLPGFDENAYVAASGYDGVALCLLVEELVDVRRANLAVLRRLDAEGWARVGTASGQPVSVRALAYVMAGHPRHHLAILRERYGLA